MHSVMCVFLRMPLSVLSLTRPIPHKHMLPPTPNHAPNTPPHLNPNPPNPVLSSTHFPPPPLLSHTRKNNRVGDISSRRRGGC
jgi:hypothetical protein